MRFKTPFVSILCILVMMVFTSTSFAQPTAEITVKAYSTHYIEDIDTTKTLSTGLPNVGVGETVYLVANEDEDDLTFTWTIDLTYADGSAATLDVTDEQMVSFIPDVAGQYKVTVTVTGTGGSDETYIWINAGTFVGIGIIGDATPSWAKGQCAVCHTDKVTDWMETGHYSIFQEGIDGIASSHYSSSCYECHVTGFNEDADNDGFDDIAEDVGWEFPSTLQAGNFDSLVALSSDLAQLATIGCESCHGPGSEHKGVASGSSSWRNQIATGYEGGVCHTCHEAMSHHIYPLQWANSKHAVATSYPARSGCAECHTGAGFITYHDTDYDYEGTDSDLHATYTAINCQTCHDPHGNGNDHQLRVLEDVSLGDPDETVFEYTVEKGGYGMLCMNCHKSSRDATEYAENSSQSSHFGPHHGPQTDMLFGVNAYEYGLTNHGSSPHADIVENTCVTCHMQEFDADDYGVSGDFADTLMYNISGHAFWNKYTAGDETEYENVSSCVTCHGEIESFDDIMANEDYDGDGTVEGVQSEVEGMLTAIALHLPPYGEDEVGLGGDTPFSRSELKAAYNYEFVLEDGSKGVHNAAYTISILKATLAALGVEDVGAGTISEITDVPNDQGKQVRVSWIKFPGDGPTTPRIFKYGVWRKVEGSMAKVSPENVIQVADVDEMYTKINEASGKLFKVGDTETWDFVKEVPAAELDTYSTIAPTVFDSTITSGMYYTCFKISGHATDNTVVMSTADSGYSVDNLVPTTPSGMAAKIVNGYVEVTWDEAVDPDVDYFTVYRSKDSDFDPATTEPLGHSATNSYTDEGVTSAGTYYYVLAAVDFSGNTSEFTAKLEFVATGVEPEGTLVPTEFGISQNYPNPFNPTTHIKYQLPEAAKVTIKVYNILGEEVRTLVDSKEAAGYKTTMWDGLDNNGTPVASGIYLYRIKAGKYTATKRMVFIK